jgi:hypothetical protein
LAADKKIAAQYILNSGGRSPPTRPNKKAKNFRKIDFEGLKRAKIDAARRAASIGGNESFWGDHHQKLRPILGKVILMDDFSFKIQKILRKNFTFRSGFRFGFGQKLGQTIGGASALNTVPDTLEKNSAAHWKKITNVNCSKRGTLFSAQNACPFLKRGTLFLWSYNGKHKENGPKMACPFSKRGTIFMVHGACPFYEIVVSGSAFWRFRGSTIQGLWVLIWARCLFGSTFAQHQKWDRFCTFLTFSDPKISFFRRPNPNDGSNPEKILAPR